METRKLDSLSLDDYIGLKLETNTKYEYHKGSVMAKGGGSISHGLISGIIFEETNLGLRNNNSNCRPINSEVKLNIQSLSKFLYPEVMVVCREIEKSTSESNAVTHPIVIIEILSKSTERTETGNKIWAE